MDKFIEWIKAWWSRHIVSEFPHEDECWGCNKSDCAGCPVINS
ncbi:MAG: hypothetical protein PVG39_24160 [Desulfobacteraceae bacterium]|jgi:hypothetical protein